MPPRPTHESPRQAPISLEANEPGMEPIEDFLADRGVESLANRTVIGHDGEPMTLAAALSLCEPARNSVDATLDTLRDAVGEDVDLVPLMERHLDRMEEKAQSTDIPDSKKK